ncbi:MAG TPA: NAD-dependent epimerase/dehydratase family protein [Kofleriaceae bacterium]|nr:NAD-dependent epimerase/dehydratase family protein [Kofleriaceae bacterium]
MILVTGGAGFIGTNLAAHLARTGRRVRIYDDLSRPGVDRNLAWLQRTFGDKIDARIADIRDRAKLRDAATGVEAVFHLAAQVAVTPSLADPEHDFDVNARGTLEVLEAVRVQKAPPPFVFVSTNEVYGAMADLPLHATATRWLPVDDVLAGRGIAETRPLEPRTPYACSKACADQYVLAYARSFGIPATVLRTSCVYGPHQVGSEDQGLVAQFLMRAIETPRGAASDGRPIAIHGDGKQTRDLLFVDDLVDAFVRAWSRVGALAGHAFNLGGGPANALGLTELLGLIESLCGRAPELRHGPWRSGDQKYYVSDATAFAEATGWSARVAPRAGIEALYGWLVDPRSGVAAPSGKAGAFDHGRRG